MDRIQRLDDTYTTIKTALRAQQGGIQTAMPGIVQSYDPSKMTCTVQPAIQGVLSNPKTGQASNVNLPLLVDCPVIFPSGGGVTLTFPITKGDECLVIFASRCIDAWWQNGGIQPPMEYRMHDLSDGFVLVGPRSQVNLVSAPSTTAVEMRTADGSVKVSIDGTSKMVTIDAPSGLTGTGTWTIDGDIVLNGKSIKDHIHSGVTVGSGDSGMMV